MHSPHYYLIVISAKNAELSDHESTLNDNESEETTLEKTPEWTEGEEILRILSNSLIDELQISIELFKQNPPKQPEILKAKLRRSRHLEG